MHQTERTHHLVEEQSIMDDNNDRVSRFVYEYVNKIIEGNESLSKEDEDRLRTRYKDQSPEEKALELYRKFIVYTHDIAERKQEGKKTERREDASESSVALPATNPKLISRINVLFNDPAVRKIFVQKFAQARIERGEFRTGDSAKQWQHLESGIHEKRERMDILRRDLFQEKIRGASHIEEAKQELQELREEIEEEVKTQAELAVLTNKEKVAVNTDQAALMEYERLKKYRQQMDEGFVWLPSREEIDRRAMKVIESGNPTQTRKGIFFISEPGSGKTEQIRAIARRLTGMDRLKIGCGPRIGEPQLLGKEKVFPGAKKIEQGVFVDYREAVTGAWTGYDYSHEKQSMRAVAKVVELDEMTKAFENETFFTILKGLFALKDGDAMPSTDKPILPGRVLIGSGNVGAHHGNKPIPPALEREFEVIPVDYTEMTDKNPELYEFMLACLMDEGALVAVNEKELAPHYKKRDLPEDNREVMSDGSTVVAVDELVEDPTDKHHGFLYRLAHAVKAVQNSYMARGGENPYIDYTKRELLRSHFDDKGVLQITNTGDQIILASTITLNDVQGWMRGYKEITQQKKAPTLTAWLQEKLQEKIDAKYEDQDKLQAIFEHFHLLEKTPSGERLQPLTPKEIGYLSPRVPRPVHVEYPVLPTDEAETQQKALPEIQELIEYETREVVLEKGGRILIGIGECILEDGVFDLTTEKFKPLVIAVGKEFRIGNEAFVFAGIVQDEESQDNGLPIGRHAGEELYRIISPEQLQDGIINETVYIAEQDFVDLEQDVKEYLKENK